MPLKMKELALRTLECDSHMAARHQPVRLLPPRSTAGQLTLDQHIGVRIPGGQPNPVNHLLVQVLKIGSLAPIAPDPNGGIERLTCFSRARIIESGGAVRLIDEMCPPGGVAQLVRAWDS